MATAISPDIVTHVRELLAEKTPYRRIAKKLGISQGTVGKIASGRHPHARKRRRPPEGHAYCRECNGIYPAPCPRCAERDRITAEVDGILFSTKWTDNVEPVSQTDQVVIDTIADLVDCDTGHDDRWALTEGGTLCKR